MSTNEFDRLIRDKFDNGEFEYNPKNWELLSRKLDHTDQTDIAAPAGIIRWLPKAGMAAGIALVIGLSAYFMNQAPSGNTPSVAGGPVTPAHTNTPVTTGSRPATGTATTQPGAVGISTAPVISTKPVTQSTVTSYSVAPAANTEKETGTVLPQQQNTNDQLVHNTPPQNLPQKDAEQPEKKNILRQPVQPDFSENAYAGNDGYKKRNGASSFSLAGGMNYGSMKTGYSVGVSARTHLGNGNFYLEGDLAFVNSTANKAASVSDAQYDALNSNYSGAFQTGSANTGGNGGPAALAAVSAPVKTVTQEQVLNNLYYLQFSPSVGYSIRKNVSVSLGADVQRLLQNNSNETPVVLEADELKLIPQTDVGLTGKAEYGVTRRLKAGMMYREGVNSLIDNKYISRRYVQVQLKLMLFGK